MSNELGKSPEALPEINDKDLYRGLRVRKHRLGKNSKVFERRKKS